MTPKEYLTAETMEVLDQIYDLVMDGRYIDMCEENLKKHLWNLKMLKSKIKHRISKS